MSKNIGFVATRFKGTDGVSLESAKWAQVLWDDAHHSFWYSGRADRHPELSVVIPEAALDAEENRWINERVLGRTTRDRTVTAKILDVCEFLKDSLYEFVKRFDVDVLIAENSLSIPMHIPLGLALTQFIAETGIPTIAHHHDFYWERTRFSVNAVKDLLSMAFPPSLPAIQHVTISSFAQEQLSLRRGVSSVVVPNVLDFDNPPDPSELRGDEFRQALGIEPGDVVFLQPTRVIPRKGIEHSIALIAQLRFPKCKLIVSHETGDEGFDYKLALEDMARDEGIDLLFVDTHVGEIRTERDGENSYTLEDAYSTADFITYPSLYEGFGNALIEAFYYRKPVLVNRYSIFISDIEPKGFRVITMDGYLTRDVVEKVRRVIEDSAHRKEIVSHNYEMGRQQFSYRVLRHKLGTLMTSITGLEERIGASPAESHAMDERFAGTVCRLLGAIYGDRAESCLPRLLDLVTRHRPALGHRARRAWDERDVALITYGDQVLDPSRPPLRELREFLDRRRLHELFSVLHLLPFFPCSSDGGFSVVDYRAVEPRLGSWNDVRDLGARFDLAFDLVLNHASSRGAWFEGYLAGEEPHVRYFVEADPDADLSAVARPRSSPLLTPFETSRGTRHLWTTFGPDQVDLNYREPDVLLEMLDVALHHVAMGARVLRLDAVAYLWKEAGTSSIHRPEVHAFVKLLRALLDELAPDVWLLTETNVPHEENVAYFGDGDEAHLVYQFSLPPLLLDAYLNADAGPLANWLRELMPEGPGTTFVNFTASHDGIGVRPLEGRVSETRLERLVEAVERRGGLVSRRRTPAGEVPYELNITYLDALGGLRGEDPDLAVRRFLGSQALMLALRGIPAVYFHSLVGSSNDLEAVRATGRPRAINRRKLDSRELERRLSEEGSVTRRVFGEYVRMLRTRIEQPAFHPDAEQRWRETEHPDVVAFSRGGPGCPQGILVLGNLGPETRRIELSRAEGELSLELLGRKRERQPLRHFELGPFRVAWLSS